MIRLELGPCDDATEQLDPFLLYVTEKMAGERSDSHDTATLAYVVVRNIRDSKTSRPRVVEHWVSNEGARAAWRELRMFLAYQSNKGMDVAQIGVRSRIVRLVFEQLNENIKRQDSAKWARERDKNLRNRPTVRDARTA
jgi:hypothetical protein